MDWKSEIEERGDIAGKAFSYRAESRQGNKEIKIIRYITS
jgi:hypothetical protein